ncbi:MAG: ribosomal RNA small subunit methyltransferase A [Treponema sp.]|uniref:16S rRNA (adenine(1518)-N(6)/adenine(1519)-N(6))- dimethyltransferase RsmA n=1 Tax=Treponema sp. TaxID=166 RepID=UPI00298D95AF|nr:16S rRNA (adenine(1518)-N(6)/adenine(1519)-N(6))-dimethyltransferase RsmA [Treponema sp.]MBR5934436.1 ribosomal RNA small subunit methyltransferase A [Treponema sp.]
MLSHPDYNSAQSIKNFLDTNGLAMQKKFGQNFLINQNARKKIIDALDVNENTTVWEVGPGLGCMTDEILSRNASVTAFEIDKGFANCLKDFFNEYSDKNKFSLVEGDVLKTWKKELSAFREKNGKDLPERFFGNLPYNIAATLIAETIEKNIRFEKCVFTIQKEVAKRMSAKPGEDDYSSFSVLCSWAYDVSDIMDLSGSNFWPKPNVDSRSVLLTKKKDFPCCDNPELFCKVQRALFSSRRKTVKNNLTQFLSSSDKASYALDKAGIDPTLRAEVLTVGKMLVLSDVINKDIIG